MTNMETPQLFSPERWFRAGRGPRYEQLYRHIAAAISSGVLEPQAQIPPERDLAALAQVSRVTVRQAVANLVSDGVLDQRRGAGTFVKPQPQRLEQSLSRLISFTEHMQQRGKTSTSVILQRGLFPLSPDEQLAAEGSARGYGAALLLAIEAQTSEAD